MPIRSSTLSNANAEPLPFNGLPNVAKSNIFSFLDIPDLANASLVSRE